MLLAAVALLPVGRACLAEGPDFAREVRPLLSNRCFKCHGPDEDHQEAGLRLDVREVALAELDSGTRAIVPGHPDDSELIARITSTDPDLVMPPRHTKVTLTEEREEDPRGVDHGRGGIPATLGLREARAAGLTRG